jgi:hypothetical protein
VASAEHMSVYLYMCVCTCVTSCVYCCFSVRSTSGGGGTKEVEVHLVSYYVR